MLEATAGKVWFPNEGPQTDAYFSEADELFYGGAAGGGKTDLIIGLAFNEHTKARLIRREGTHLKGIEARMTEIRGGTQGYNQQLKTWRHAGGRIILGSCPHEKDKYEYQGQDDDLKAFDEITQFTRGMYFYIIGWNRSTKAGQRCRVVVTGNPPQTADGQWVKVEWAPWLDRNFPNPAMPGELRWYTTDPVTAETIWVGEDWVGEDAAGDPIYPKSRTFIPARMSDNPYFAPDTEAGRKYRATIAALPEPLRTQLLEGDFNVAEADQQNQVIPTAWIRAAQARWTPGGAAGKRMVAVGADIAQGGEARTVVAPRFVGYYFDKLTVKRGAETPDGPTAAGVVVSVLRNDAQANVDMGGGFGQSCFDHLKQLRVRAFKFVPSGASTKRTGAWLRRPGETPPPIEKAPVTARADGSAPLDPFTGGYAGIPFKNLRAEAYWRFREILDPVGPHKAALPPDEELVAELAAPRWELRGGEIILEPKEHVALRLGRSPDKGDAVVIAAAAPEGDGVDRKEWNEPLEAPFGTMA